MRSQLTWLCPVWVTLALLVTGPVVIANPIGFECITGGCGSLAPQLSLVVDQTAEKVVFTIHNTGSISTSVTGVYWDDANGILSNPVLSNSPGVDFTLGGSPSNLPGGNTVGFDADFLVSNVKKAENGINPGESLTVTFDATGDVLAAMSGGSLRVGLKLNAEGGSLVTSPSDLQPQGDETPVSTPEPSSVVLLGGGLVVMAFFAFRRLFR